MGNRAVVSAAGSKVGVYLHWNGGRESVRAFLRAAKDLGVRNPVDDESYFLARFVQIIGNFFGGTTSVGIGLVSELDTDNGDNGHFVINNVFEIVEQRHPGSPDRRSKAELQEYEDYVYADVMEKNKAAFEERRVENVWQVSS